MARDLRPKNKKARRANMDLGLKTNTNKLGRRLNIPPGQHGRQRRRKVSDYGEQLAEKQKLKLMFGVLERQFHGYYRQASQTKAATGEMILQLLERRLDNVVFRLRLAPTRPAARQLVTHGHVLVNGKKITIPSYQINPEDTVTLSTKAQAMPITKKLLADKKAALPKWLKKKAAVGFINRLPVRDDMELEINEQLIVEYYSR